MTSKNAPEIDKIFQVFVLRFNMKPMFVRAMLIHSWPQSKSVEGLNLKLISRPKDL